MRFRGRRRLIRAAVAVAAVAASGCAPAAVQQSPKAGAVVQGTAGAVVQGGAGAGASDTLITEPAAGPAPFYRIIGSARHQLDMTMYELVDRRADALLEADAARGVNVRVVLDANRERSPNTPAFRQLSAHGVHVRWAASSYPATHEKTLVVDDRMAVIMTLNLTARYYDDTRDFAVVDRNRRDVKAIEAVFDADFAGRRSAPTPRGADLLWSPGAAPRLVALIAHARRSLLVENEEMSDHGIVAALAAAARRGVDVTVVMTGDGEYDAELRELAGVGVHVRVYAENASLYIHAKAIVADGTTVAIGSQNFSATSLDHNRELGVILPVRRIAASVARTIEADARGAQPLPPAGSTKASEACLCNVGS
jgi:cardiolipin synthase A/B